MVTVWASFSACVMIYVFIFFIIFIFYVFIIYFLQEESKVRYRWY